MRNILFWCSEIGSKTDKTLDESNNCCYECVDIARQTPAAQIQESSQVGKRQCIMLAWRNAIGQIAPGRVLVALRNDSCRDARKPPHSSPCGSRGQPCNVPSRTTSRPGLENLPAKRMKRQAKGDMGRVFAIAKKLKSGHDRPHRVIRDEPGGDAHWAELLHGQETRWSELANVAQRIRHTTHREETNGSAHVALYPGCFGRRNPRKATGPQRHSHFCGGKRVAKAAHEYCWHCSTPLG